MLGILVVSHSEDAARGIAQIASGMAGDAGVKVVGVGGNDEGGLGVSVAKIMGALSSMLPDTDGVLIIPDLGGSVLSSLSAVGMLPPGDAAKITIADAPTLEGAMMAAVEASCGSPMEKVAGVAASARELKKIDH